MNRCSIYRSQSRVCQTHSSRSTNDGFYEPWIVCSRTCVALAYNTRSEAPFFGNRAWVAAGFRCHLYYRRVAIVCSVLLKLVAHPLRHFCIISVDSSVPTLRSYLILPSSANRIPERFAPGRFDYFFASHQVFHFCVVFAALAHYYSALKSFEFRLSRPQFCRL
jgi:Haemolysin-III related